MKKAASIPLSVSRTLPRMSGLQRRARRCHIPGGAHRCLGVHEGVGYYLLFNGILGDKRPDGGNVLTRRLLAELPAHDGPKVIYGESSRLSKESLLQLGITFKQTPYDVKAR